MRIVIAFFGAAKGIVVDRVWFGSATMPIHGVWWVQSPVQDHTGSVNSVSNWVPWKDIFLDPVGDWRNTTRVPGPCVGV